MEKQLCYTWMGKGKGPGKQMLSLRMKKSIYGVVGARNQQPYQHQLHCFPPFHSALRNLRKTGASSNLHWRSERCHNWACFPCWLGGRANKDETKWSEEKAPVLPKLMRTGGPRCPVACLWNSFFKVSCRIAKMLSSLPFSLMEGKRLVSNKSVVCMTASWSECDQRVLSVVKAWARQFERH